MRKEAEIILRLVIYKNLLRMFKQQKRRTRVKVLEARIEELEWVLEKKEENPSKR